MEDRFEKVEKKLRERNIIRLSTPESPTTTSPTNKHFVREKARTRVKIVKAHYIREKTPAETSANNGRAEFHLLIRTTS